MDRGSSSARRLAASADPLSNVSYARRPQVLLSALLACAVLAVYAQVYRHGFVEYDDPGYVSENSIVRRGLTAEGVRWAFTTGRLGNWNPLVWLSHMLDVQLFGLNAGAHHLVSVALHIVNTLLLFAVLRRTTRALWPSFAVAALFGLHPLHVESVAWIAERKDVLSTLFWMLTIWAYAHYVEGRSARWYAATLAFFALGLMAKPMLVTLPFVLLLLDVWPLGRLALPSGAARRAGQRASRPPSRRSVAHSDEGTATAHAVPLATLLWEKAPLLLLTVAFSVLAYLTQVSLGAVAAADKLPLGLRVSNALVAYVRYLIMALWPVDLAVLYPYDVRLPLWQPVAAALCLGAMSVLVLRIARRHPYALVGWLWYLGTLVPVIGLVQIGSQALADRYTYVPLIGVFIMIAWGARSLVTHWAIPAPIVGTVAAAAIGAYAAAAWAQVGLWRDGETLLSHAIAVTRDNAVAHNNLGVALGTQGKTDAAMQQFREALRIKADYADAHNNVGLAFWRQARLEEAAAQYRQALQYDPDSAETHSNLGLVLTAQGRTDEAIAQLSEAVRLDPEFAGAHNNLGNALREAGRTQEAIARYEQAMRINPDYADPYNNLGGILAHEGRREEAIVQFQAALRRDPQSVDARSNLALVLTELGKMDEAIGYFSEAVRLGPDQADVRINLANALRDDARLQEAIEQYEQVLRQDPESADAHYNYGLALIKVGRTQEAIGQFRAALQRLPDHAMAHNDLGVALVEAGQLREAIEHFDQALRLDPDLPDAQINLELARSMAQTTATPQAPAQ